MQNKCLCTFSDGGNMKVIIAGTRTFNNYQLLCNTIKELNINIDEIVCGRAKGADALGEKDAKENNIPIKYFLADWDKYGKGAGPIRNHQMGDYADYLIAFWDKKSKGTLDMINYMQQIGKHGKVIYYCGGPA